MQNLQSSCLSYFNTSCSTWKRAIAFWVWKNNTATILHAQCIQKAIFSSHVVMPLLVAFCGRTNVLIPALLSFYTDSRNGKLLSTHKKPHTPEVVLLDDHLWWYSLEASAYTGDSILGSVSRMPSLIGADVSGASHAKSRISECIILKLTIQENSPWCLSAYPFHNTNDVSTPAFIQKIVSYLNETSLWLNWLQVLRIHHWSNLGNAARLVIV